MIQCKVSYNGWAVYLRRLQKPPNETNREGVVNTTENTKNKPHEYRKPTISFCKEERIEEKLECIVCDMKHRE